MNTERRSLVGLAVVAAALHGCSGGSSEEATEAAPADQTTVPGSGEESGADAMSPADAWFVDITAALGLDVTHQPGPAGRFLLPEIMGGGVALFDADGDGRLDLYFVNGNDHLPAMVARGTTVNRLFMQQEDGRFVEATATSGLDDAGYGMGVAVGDVDNDGDDDVFVTNYGPDRLYLNRGDGTFGAHEMGVEVDGWSASAAFADYDRDGDLDLFVTRYLIFHPPQACTDKAGREDFCGPKSYPSPSDVLLRNNGDGTFTDVSEVSGLTAVNEAGLGVVAEDFDDDGWIDFYVANDGDPNHLWVNQHDGTFKESALMQGAAFNMHGQSEAGMGVIAFDVEDDGDFDLFMTHQARETNTLYVNNGGGRGFRDATGPAGLAASSLPYTGFGTCASDIDLDGDLDLIVVGGRVMQEMPREDAEPSAPWNRYAEPNLVYLNDNGRFTVSDHGGTLVSSVHVTRGLAIGDLDGDGDEDVVVTNIAGPARVYRNESPRAGHWVAVRTVDPRLNRVTPGARVVVASGERRWHRTVRRAFSYLSSSPAVAHVGLGPVDRIDSITVRWPDGLTEVFEVDGVDRQVELLRGDGRPVE